MLQIAYVVQNSLGKQAFRDGVVSLCGRPIP
jgi:hypothetical protein